MAPSSSRARAVRPDLGVIYMSGFAGDARDAQDLEAPRTSFLAMPFHPNLLSRALADLLTPAPGQGV